MKRVRKIVRRKGRRPLSYKKRGYGRRVVGRIANAARAAAGTYSSYSGYTNLRSMYKKAVKRRSGGSGPPAKRQRRINDPQGYQQLQRFKFRSGKKKPILATLIKSVTVQQRMRFSGINEFTTGFGYFDCAYRYLNATTNVMPVWVINLTAIRNGSSTPAVLYRMTMDNTTGSPSWSATNSLGPTTALANCMEFEDTESTLTGHDIGRKGLLRWTRLRLNIWGKKQQATDIKIQIGHFTQDGIAPDFPNGPDANVGADYWKHLVKPLINNPCSSSVTTIRPKKIWKSLKEYNVCINPTSSTESDADPHAKFLDIFNRWDRMFDFSTGNTTGENFATLDAAGQYGQSSAGYSGKPQLAEKNLYCVISSFSPTYLGSTAAIDSTLSASFDMNFQSSWSTVQAS